MYALSIGLRYLKSKKRSTVSVITVIAILAVALGVGSFLSVLSITSGFQDEFREKVLGVNAHVLILKYGLDFSEYREVMAEAEEQPEVVGAAPFLINEMMLARGDRLSGVLVKGVDPELMLRVLDLPDQIVEGSLEGLRLPGSVPPVSPDNLVNGSAEDLDALLENLIANSPDEGAGGETNLEEADTLTDAEMEALREEIARTGGQAPVIDGEVLTPEQQAASMDATSLGQAPESDVEPLPEVSVPTLAEAEEALRQLEEGQGLPTDTEEQEFFVAENETGEPLIADEDLPGVVVGATLARNLDLSVGDRVQVISPLAGLDTSMWAPDVRTPRSREFRIIGVFQAGFQEYDSRLVYVDLHEAQRFFDHGDTVTGVELRLEDLEDAPEIAERIERLRGQGPFRTMDWHELNENLFTALQLQKIVLTIVIATIVVVAAFCVVATLIMMVLEKKREIAILKAMGAKDLSILSMFVLQGLVIGLFGTLLGLLFGGIVVFYLDVFEFPLDPKVYLIDHLPVRISGMEFVITTIVSMVICTLATLGPSWWAARLLPADGVRYE